MKFVISNILILFGLLFLPLVSFSQTQISGVVLDNANREPLIGVNVVVKGTVLGTVTDFYGKFNLSVQAAPPITLAITSIGYNGQEIEINECILGLEIIFEKLLKLDKK